MAAADNLVVVERHLNAAFEQIARQSARAAEPSHSNADGERTVARFGYAQAACERQRFAVVLHNHGQNRVGERSRNFFRFVGLGADFIKFDFRFNLIAAAFPIGELGRASATVGPGERVGQAGALRQLVGVHILNFRQSGAGVFRIVNQWRLLCRCAASNGKRGTNNNQTLVLHIITCLSLVYGTQT